MDLINPNSNLSINQEKLLDEMKLWTVDKQIVGAAIKEGIATQQQLVGLAVRIQATLDRKGPYKEEKPLTPKDTAVCAHHLLSNRIVRQQIARFEARRNRISRQEAMKGLWQTREFLEEQYSIEAMRAAQDAGVKVLG